MKVLLIFLSQFDVEDRGKAPTTTEAATPFDEDILDVPNLTYMRKKKIKNINLEIMGIFSEPNPTKEMVKRQHELMAQTHCYEVSSNISLVIKKISIKVYILYSFML